jgi:Tfp pilus assembly protein PilZ
LAKASSKESSENPVREKRRRKRIEVSALASFFGERAITAGVIRNLSVKGIQVMTEAEVCVGDTVQIKVDLPEGRGALLALARVAWHKPSTNPFHPHLLGLEFVQIGHDELAKLEAFALEHGEIPVQIQP